MAKRGVSWANYRHGTMVGGSVPEAVAFMENELGYAVDVEEIGGEIYASVQSIVAAGISPMVGAVELLNVLKGSRPLAVASNGSRETVLASLRAARIPNVFDVVVGLGATSRPKPAPDLYLEACRQLNVRPADAIAIEDSFRGATAAKLAGMRVVGVGTARRVEEVSDLVVTTLLEPDLLDLLGITTTL
jgi:HAD superfamily hydrolase (TIGR01509 family)